MPVPGAVAASPWRQRNVWLLAAWIVLPAAGVGAQPAPRSLADIPLEDLMNIEVTSASRREQRAADIPAAVHVITNEEIRRSGLTSVPELLRLAPGVQVARIDASKWAVAIRGGNHRFSDKLLVLIDGRTVYTRQFSGVHWDSLNVMVEEIDRIEVIRGPGGAVWGANAVNGVINIITKSASETRGTAIRATLGDNDARSVAVRYGGTAGATSYRVHVDSTQHPHTMLDPSTPAEDDWTSLNIGARLDWKGGRDRVLARTDVVRSDANFRFAFPDGVVPPPFGWPTRLTSTDATRASGLVRWTRDLGAGQTFEAQAFLDIANRNESYQEGRSSTYDADFKYELRRGRHNVVSGAGFRQTHDHLEGTFITVFEPSDPTLRVFNAFVQDELSLAGDRVRVTGGVKIERETYSGWGVQPTGRVVWLPTARQRLWGAVSRARRTPSMANRSIRVNFTSFIGEEGLPVLVSLLGNPEYETEETTSVEAGYRFDLHPVSFDVAVFTNHHSHLTTQERLPPRVDFAYGTPHILVATQFANLMHADTHGAEMAARWSATPWWHVDATYTFFRFNPDPDPGSTDPNAALADGNAPRHQWSLRTGLTLGPRVGVNAAVWRVGRIGSLGVPAYTRSDVRLEWKVASDWSLVLSGQNLVGDPHAEFAGTENVTTTTLIPRQLFARVLWRF